ncbi:Mu transposase C-terminal domain-containing protein [Clostridium gasigenes]|uniref:Mu transposase, C-terminal n=1 Tax=Clostridium gasigenes TaxID=94869 RepID=A0A1H0S280_9CLOT|nr:Mu transposase C-terminal domain-containing protein [Clostridium gasigenes]SDP35804.1 Mu transposase, C-terminal [Clostridium gasigenes]
MLFKENMIFELNEIQYRIIGSDEKNEDIFIIEMKRGSHWNNVINRSKLEDYFNKKLAKEVLTDKYSVAYETELSEKALKKQRLYREIIAFILKNSMNNEIFYSNSRKLIIDTTISKFNISESTIKRVFSRYLKNGKVISRLVNLNNCGGKGKERKITYKDEDIVAVDEQFRKVFKQGINKYYNTSKKNSIRVCYELTIRDYLRQNKDAKIPSLKQFYYWHNKLIENDKKSVITKRYGDRIYQQTGTAIVGSSMQNTLAPSDLYEVDSTILDLYIVSSMNRSLILGRPVLYMCINVYSRLIVSVNVTIEPFNSYTGMQTLLVNAFTDKVKYCKSFGIDIKQEEWDVKCIPNRILTDRGELLSGNIENAITNLGIIIQNTPPYSGQKKGIIEKSFERMHSLIRPFLEGWVENKFNKIERGNVDYRLRANVNLSEITKIIIKCVLFNNNHHVLNFYESDGLDIENDIAKIPRLIWEYGVKQKKGLLRELAEDVVKINLLPNREVTVTAKGVRFNKLYYVSSYSLEQGWHQKARLDGSFKIRISYNPNDLTEIYYIKEDGMTVDTLILVTHLSHYKGLSEEELNKIMEYEKTLNKKAEEEEVNAKIELYNEIENIAGKAKIEQERTKDKSISKTARLRNIRDNMEVEREHYRKDNADSRECNIDEDDNELGLFEDIANEWGDEYE